MTDAAPTRVLPPGPFPPHGQEPEGTVDLGLRMRDALYTRQIVTGAVRGALGRRLSQLAATPHRLVMGLHLVEIYLDTWPVGALIDQAREKWTEGADGPSLAVLARCAHLVAASLGWPATIDRRWPMPDEEWMREQTGDGPLTVVSRGPRDGAPAVAVALDAPWSEAQLVDLPPVLRVGGDEVGDRLEELLRRLRDEEGAAVFFDSPVPWTADIRAALETLREEFPAQRAFERYGLAGLIAPDAPSFEELLTAAPPGTPGDRLRPVCEVAMVPSLTKDGEVRVIGCLLWDAPYRHVAVVAGAAEVVRQFEGGHHVADVAKLLEVEVATVREVVRQLVAVGALTAA